MKTALAGMDALQIAGHLGIKPFQGRQIARWLYRRQVFDFDKMTDLSMDLRQRLDESCVASRLSLVRMEQSPRGGAKKALLRLPDGETVESVLIRDRGRVTLCLSSQVGCALQCAFCATGVAGFQRDLSPAEIVEQALHLLAGEALGGRTPNIVYMGMGEPFRNYDAVAESIRLLMSGEGLGIGARKITVSTAGEVGGITRFAGENWQVRLSVSLHAANDGLRSRLVPLNRKYPLERLRRAILEYIDRTGRQVTFEWTLLNGVNDAPEHARELAEYMHGIKASVNLIPWNPVPGMDYAPSPRRACEAFRYTLERRGITATLRKEQGGDIEAACGQLRRIHAE